MPNVHKYSATLVHLMLVFAIACLSACTEAVDTEQDSLSIGGSHPEAITASFFEDLNQALQDDQISETETQRIWAERLASYFAPSERADQRIVMYRTLQNFAYNLTLLEDGQHLTVEISYSDIELVRQNEDRAEVRLINGEIHLEKIRMTPDDRSETLVDQTRPLAEVLGQTDNIFPVLQVNGRWFMTER